MIVGHPKNKCVDTSWFFYFNSFLVTSGVSFWRLTFLTFSLANHLSPTFVYSVENVMLPAVNQKWIPERPRHRTWTNKVFINLRWGTITWLLILKRGSKIHDLEFRLSPLSNLLCISLPTCPTCGSVKATVTHRLHALCFVQFTNT